MVSFVLIFSLCVFAAGPLPIPSEAARAIAPKVNKLGFSSLTNDEINTVDSYIAEALRTIRPSDWEQTSRCQYSLSSNFYQRSIDTRAAVSANAFRTLGIIVSDDTTGIGKGHTLRDFYRRKAIFLITTRYLESAIGASERAGPRYWQAFEYICETARNLGITGADLAVDAEIAQNLSPQLLKALNIPMPSDEWYARRFRPQDY